jgi:hypothetical protein
MPLLLLALIGLSGCGFVASIDVDNDEDKDGTNDDLDCDFLDPDINPNAEEIPFDGVDQNCNGMIDEDMDGDGQLACEKDAKPIQDHCDCDDNDPTIFTGTFETKDSYDNNCDDEGDEYNSISDFETTNSETSYIEDDCNTVVLSLAAGDVNNDGYSEVVLGETEAFGESSRSGLAHILSGSQNKIDSDTFTLDQSAYSILGAYENDRFGSAVAVGDLDGDGVLDVAVGAKAFDTNETSTGVVGVYSGASLEQSMPYDASIVNLTGDYGFSYAGAALAFGNVNADAYDDLFIASYGLDGSAGAVYLYQGGASFVDGSLEEVADEVIYGEYEDDQFGWSISSGDFNGDGYDDLLVGAPQSTNLSDALDAGSVSLFLGDGASIETVPSSMFYGEHAYDNAGKTATFVSDVNGDGKEDLLIGAPGYNNDREDSGRAYLIYGSDTLASVQSLADADVIYSGTTEGQQLGIALAGIGDMNGDSFADIALSGFRDTAFKDPADDDDLGKSAVYVFWGAEHLSNQQTSSQADAAFVGNSPDQLFFVNGASDYTGQIYSSMGPYADLAIAYVDTESKKTVLSIIPGRETDR